MALPFSAPDAQKHDSMELLLLLLLDVVSLMEFGQAQQGVVV